MVYSPWTAVTAQAMTPNVQGGKHAERKVLQISTHGVSNGNSCANSTTITKNAFSRAWYPYMANKKVFVIFFFNWVSWHATTSVHDFGCLM